LAIYRSVQMTFWTDAKVVDTFTPEDKYFYLYLFTNPHTNLCGCYEISKTQMSIELGYSKETIDRLIDRFSSVHKVAIYENTTKEMLIINWHKYNWTESDRFRVALKREIDNIKSPEFKDYLTRIYDGDDTVSIPYSYGMDTTVTDTVTVYKDIFNKSINNTLNNKKEKPIKNIIPPTVEMVKQYCEERQNGIDAERFCNFYQSKDWRIGKDKMKDWQAAVRTWESKRKQDAKNDEWWKNA